MLSILHEADAWVRTVSDPMWETGELDPERTLAEIEAGQYQLAEVGGEPVGTFRFQLVDEEFWPDIDPGDSAFVHRLAVRRTCAGRGVSTAMLRWACDRTDSLGRRWLRLDCDAHRHRLGAFYEQFGFTRHSDRQVGPYFVTRYELDVRRPSEPPPRK